MRCKFYKKMNDIFLEFAMMGMFLGILGIAICIGIIIYYLVIQGNINNNQSVDNIGIYFIMSMCLIFISFLFQKDIIKKYEIKIDE